MTCVILAANRAFGLTSSRLPLIKRFLAQGWQVVAVVSPDNYLPLLEATGVTIEPVNFVRQKGTPGSDLGALRSLISIYRRYQPQLIQQFHTKPMVLGTLASYFTPQAKLVNTITGLGYAYEAKGLTKQITIASYQLLGHKSDALIFQNPDDRQLFLDKGWVKPEKTHLIISSGVDTDKFSPSQEPRTSLRVLMVTRLLFSKGVREYVAAAKQLKATYPEVKFQLAGEWETQHPDGVSREWLEKTGTEIEFLGYLNNMASELRQTDIFVLPSYYREGVPRVLLEAAAAGVPVVTTDFPGCREAVVKDVTGYLVTPRDTQELTSAIAQLLDHPQMRAKMGQAGREYIENHFEIGKITSAYGEVYQQLGIK